MMQGFVLMGDYYQPIKPLGIAAKDIAYFAAVKQPVPRTMKNIKNISASNSVFFDSKKQQDQTRQLITHENQRLSANQQLHFLKTERSAFDGKFVGPIDNRTEREARPQCGRDARLVKGRKSPTRTLSPDSKARAGLMRERLARVCKALNPPPKIAEGVYSQADFYYENQASGNSRAYLMRRDWSNEYKMQMIYKPRPSDAPAVNVGERYTEKLTGRAVKKIFESGAYVAAAHGGFTTFLTLTFDAETRNRIFSGEITIGQEVSRFLDSAKKMYQRGWEYSNERGEKCKVSGAHDLELVGPKNQAFHYIWVAECPANEDGEPNPHIHVLLNWKVSRDLFKPWAARLENIWGHGFANLERIKYSSAAGAYIIKAVGYAAKGDNADQGLIRGNRYNIAKVSRAPDWEVLASFEAGNMAGIIKECGYKLEQWRKPFQREIRQKTKRIEKQIQGAAIARNQNRTAQFEKIMAKVEEMKAENRTIKAIMKGRGVYANSRNNFSITFDGENAATRLDDFLLWARGARGWSMNCDGNYLEDIKAQADKQYSESLKRFKTNQQNWKSLLELGAELPIEPSYEKIQNMRAFHYETMQGMGFDINTTSKKVRKQDGKQNNGNCASERTNYKRTANLH